MSCHLAVRLAAELTETSAVEHYVFPWSEFFFIFIFFCFKFPELGITCDMPAEHLTMSPFLSCFSTSLLLALLPSSCPCLLKSRQDQDLLLSLCDGKGSQI